MASVFPPDSPFITAFGLLAAQEETPVVTVDFPYNINTAYVTPTVANGGTVTQANSQAVLQTGTNPAGAATLESLISARYSPGQGQIGRFTAAFLAGGVANSQQEIGIGDSVDGFFFGFQNSTFGTFRRQNGSDFFIPQSAWNGGANLPGFDPHLGNVYMVRYQWLGYGAIRYYVESPATGEITLVNTIQYENTSIIPSIFNPNLPVHARVVNTGNTSNITLLTASMGMYSEGPQNQDGGRFAVSNQKANITPETSIFALQNKATVFGGQTNRSRLHIDSVGSAFVGGSGAAQYRMVLNPTLGGTPVFNDISTNQSIAAFDVAGTTVTGGRALRIGPNTGGATLNEDVSSFELRLNPGDVVAMTGQSFGGNVTVNLALSWREEV